MEIALEKINETEALIKITLNQDDYQKSVDEKIKDYSKKANIKGFRPGKVPTGVIKSMYGKSILVDEINALLSSKLMEYLQESELQVLAEPIPNLESMNAVDWDNQKDFDFEYKIGFAEEFKLNVDKKLKLDFYQINVDDKVIDETIENVTNQFGEVKDSEKADDKSTVIGSLKIGSDFDEQVTIEVAKLEKSGIKALKGKTKETEVKLKLDKDLSEEYLSQLSQGQDVSAEKEGLLTINQIQNVEPAKVDEELFKKAFPTDEIENEEKFREKVKEIISSNYERESDFFFNQKTREKLIAKAKINLPDQFLKDWLVRTNKDATVEGIEGEYSMYADELKWSLIRSKLVKEKEIKTENEEVKEEAKNMIRMQFAQSGMVGDQFESSMDQFADNYLQGENGENYRKVYNQVETQKVYNFIKETASITEKTVGLEEFRKL